MCKSCKTIQTLLIILIFVTLSVIFVYNTQISGVSKDKTEVEFVVLKNATYITLGDQLYKSGLIKSPLAYKIYIKMTNPKTLQAGKYSLNKTMGVVDIVELLSKGTNYNPDIINVTFREGLPMWQIASLIEEKTNNSKEDVYDLLKDQDYINRLISEYWFLTDDIKNPLIYYPLEGYLFPDTYSLSLNTSVENIFKVMLDNTSTKLNSIKDELESNEYTIHEVLTLASIVENEAASNSDRAGVAGVFYNRLEDGWALGSDVTTYYGIKLDMFIRDLLNPELNTVNSYNTRAQGYAGKLPISPICNPGLTAIKASLNPTAHDYFFFVADKTGKTYFTKTYGEHEAMVAKLKSEGLWFQYKN